MRDSDPPSADTAKSVRLHLYVTQRDRNVLGDLADRKFGGNVSAAVRWAVVLAEEVLSDPSAATAITPQGALGVYVDARG